MDATCLASTILFFVGGGMRIAEFRQWGQRYFSLWKWTEFDEDFIKREWDWRMGQRNLTSASGLIHAVAWIIFAIPMLHVVWLSSQKGRLSIGLHAAVAVLTVAAPLTELISRTIFTGSTNTMDWIASEFRLDNWSGMENDALGWKTLELVNTAVHGMLFWIDALEYLFLSVIFLFMFVAVHAQPNPVFGRTWANFGMFLSVLSIVDFTADVLRLKDFATFTAWIIAISGLNRMIFFPIWLLWLGRLIPVAEQKLKLAEEANNMTNPLVESTNVASEVPKPVAQELVGDPDPFL